MATLLSLPVELQLAITSHLHLYSSSVRPHSSLISLSLTCQHFHLVLAPIINSKIHFTDPTQVHRYLAATGGVWKHVQSITFGDGFSTSLIERVLSLVKTGGSSNEEERVVGINELRLKEMKLSHDSSSSSVNCCSLLAAIDSFRTSLQTLELDLSTREAAPAFVAETGSGREEFERDSFSSPTSMQLRSHSQQRQRQLGRFVMSLFEFERLQNLKLSRVEFTETLAEIKSENSTSSKSKIEYLELDNCMISEEVLVELVRMTKGRLKGLVLRDCRGLTSRGLGKIVSSVGDTLETLRITLPTSSSSSSNQLSSSSRSSPGHSSPRRSPSPPLSSAPLEFSLDGLLPQLSHLISLTLSGPLLSPRAIKSLLLSCPLLRSINLSENRHLSPADLLPLLSPHSSRLSKLKTLTFYRPAVDSSETSSSICTSPSNSPSSSPRLQPRPTPTPTTLTRREEDPAVLLELASLAISNNVKLVGKDFERIEERLKWAFETIGQQSTTGTGTNAVSETGVGETQTRRRKRPGICSS
ncbi:uncharacterized protein JCM6883_006921 [Sporobolomyces salmoneus]|uniref:uncharacterized protein n=1 Tax=Sporobolomyces salmoneus TaxID=183962 RepID=UPI0031809D71